MRAGRKLPKSIVIRRRWRRPWPIAAIALAVAVVAAIDRTRPRTAGPPPAAGRTAADPSADYQRYHDRTFRVVRVVDGDTLDIEVPDGGNAHTRIRLWGVDAPEVRGRGGRLRHFGAEATDFARRTLDGREVHVLLSPHQTRGKYGRLLAYVCLERGGPIFNERLVAEGYALADRRFPHHYSRRFERAEKHAREAGLGLWARARREDLPGWYHRTTRGPSDAYAGTDSDG